MGGKLWLKVVVVVGVLAVLELTTWALFGRTQQVLTLLELSGGGWGGPPPAFTWMCVRRGTWDAMTPKQRNAVEKHLRAKRVVLYTDRNDIPDDKVMWRDQNGERRWSGYKDGSRNSCGIKSDIPCCFRGHFGNSTGDHGGYWSEGLFIWVFGRWVKVWSGRTIMA